MADADTRARRSVLIADPEASLRRQLARSLSSEPLDLSTCDNAESAISLLRGKRIDVAFIDHILLASGGEALTESLLDVEVVLGIRAGTAVAPRDVPSSVQALVDRSSDAIDGAVFAIQRALEVRDLRERASLAELRAAQSDGSGEIVVGTKSMRTLVGRAKRIAPSTAPVLVLGEPGTGKELIARFVHRTSQRGALVTLDASELSLDELERELEAVPKPSPSDRSAWDRSDGATLLLLHVEKLSPRSQEAVFSRLTSPAKRVRIIATADPTIREAAHTGAFSRDLFLALGAALLELLPLRQRRDEIPVLANHMLMQHVRNKGDAASELRIGVEAMRALRRAPWPRNVAELEATIAHAALVARTSTIVPGDLPDEQSRSHVLRSSLGEEPYAEARKHAMREFERSYVDELLWRTEQNLAQAAREAGMDRANFRRLVKRAKGETPAGAKAKPKRTSQRPSKPER
jgi:DNA-binding NtrC family response regulator